MSSQHSADRPRRSTRRTLLTAAVATTAATAAAPLAAAPAAAHEAGPPPGPGRPALPQPPDRELSALLREVDRDRIEATVRRLAAFGTRHTLSSQDDPVRGIGAARDWIFDAAARVRRRLRRPDDRANCSRIVQQPGVRIPTADPDHQRGGHPARRLRARTGSTSSPATTTPASRT